LQAARLETDLADLLAGHGVRLHRAASGRWYLESPHPLPQRPSPYRLAGRCIDPAALRGPEGGAPAWSAVLNELEMALYDHPINRDRQERGALPVNALWPWGAGTCPPAPGAFPWERVYSDEPAWCGLAALAGASHGELVGAMPAVEPQGRTLLSVSWAETALATADGTAWLDAVAAVERTLAAPALAALRGESDAVGQWDALELQTEAGAEHAVALTRGGLRRLWRRPRPLARWLAAGGEGG
ncbi:hypothetical protein CKO13_12175, partial [Halorhodospira neutriphila]|nr:hypothetical protein [Halorhodospira neutriphila]